MLAPILADASSGPLAPLIAQGGVLGVVIAGMVAAGRWIYNRFDAAHVRELAAKDSEIAALRADKAALDAALTEQTRFIRDQVVPAMTRITEVSREYASVLSRRAGGS